MTEQIRDRERRDRGRKRPRGARGGVPLLAVALVGILALAGFVTAEGGSRLREVTDEPVAVEQPPVGEPSALLVTTVGGEGDEAGSAPLRDDRCGDRPYHPPIHVRGDTSFGPQGTATQGLVQPPGVVGGNGTAEDPYVIAGWCILAPPSTGFATHETNLAGIALVDTSVHILVEDNVVLGHGSPLERSMGTIGVYLDGTENVTVRDNHVAGVEAGAGSAEVEALEAPTEVGVRYSPWIGVGLVLFDGANNTVEQNRFDQVRFEGIWLHRGARDNDVLDNRVTHAANNGLLAVDAHRNRLEGNVFSSNGHAGMLLSGSSANVLRDNVLEDNGFQGVKLQSGSSDNLVADNRIAGNAWGLQLGGAAAPETTEGNLVTGNEIVGNGEEDHHEGVLVVCVRDNLVRDNRISANERGLYVHGCVTDEAGDLDITVRGNVIEDNREEGMVAHGQNLVDARSNWWGHETGPSGGVEDCQTGAPADGQGQAIDASAYRGAEPTVCFDPWLTTPAGLG